MVLLDVFQQEAVAYFLCATKRQKLQPLVTSKAPPAHCCVPGSCTVSSNRYVREYAPRRVHDEDSRKWRPLVVLPELPILTDRAHDDLLVPVVSVVHLRDMLSVDARPAEAAGVYLLERCDCASFLRAADRRRGSATMTR